jgi:anti-sigma factor ChrR (cupin superfamily)
MTSTGMTEIMCDVAGLQWMPLVPGIEFKRLFSSPETGRWTVLLRCEAGSFIPRHKHLGAGEYFVVKGRMEYRVGSAAAGSYGYEPVGVIHDKTSFPEYTELLFTNYGPVLFLNEDDSMRSVLDYTAIEQLAGG